MKRRFSPWHIKTTVATLFALVLVLTPIAVFAAKVGTEFTANVFAVLIDPGEVKFVLHGTDGKLLQITNDEIIVGTVVGVDGWPELAGADILVEHDSKVVYDPLTGEFTNGKAKEKVELSLNGERVFSGKSKAVLFGQIDPTPCAYPGEFKGQITDVGTIKLNKGYGDFKDQTAKGDWTAVLNAVCGDPGIGFLIPLLAGNATIDGLHFVPDHDDDDDDHEDDE